MHEEYLLRWEQVVANRVVTKTKIFNSVEKRDKFRKEIMQKKQFFKLLTIKGSSKTEGIY